MEANEFRIGNLVFDDENQIVIIECITSDTAMINGYGDENFLFSKKDYPSILFYSEIKPITITKEWKDQFGKNEKVLVDESGFVIFKNGYAYQFVFEDYPFIHSIQNLFFALTGEELAMS